MSFQPGTRVGRYELGAVIGAGGMGEVYRARDTSLNRDVAVKVLPAAVVSDRERLARFQREAEALATLNHPNIAQIYGLEKHDGQPAIVMELVPGPTLADRIAAGPIPLAEALPIARQIAEGLEAAHERGIIHRDLKPANIKVTDDGAVKVLDFGLAKALEPAGDVPELSNSPTLTARATQMGIVLGTAAYMAPEQAKARRVDKRADVWAFGAVLFEMLSGRRAFEGEDASDTLASVLKEDPPYDALPRDLPRRVRQVIRGCLQKLPRERIADMQDARLALDGLFDAGPEPPPAPVLSRRSGWVWVAAGLLGVVLGLAGLVVGRLGAASEIIQSPLRRYALPVPLSHGLLSSAGTLVAISPDGQTVAYRANESGVWRIFVRSLAGSDAAAVPGTDDAVANVFFSHDGQWLVFRSGLTMSKVRVSGGRPVAITAVPAGGLTGRWEADDTIWFGSNAGLMRVPAAGGDAELVLASDPSMLFSQPDALPNGRAVLISVRERANPNVRSVMAVELGTGQLKPLLPDAADARYAATGHLLFVRDGALWAARFDQDRLEVAGQPLLVEQGIRVELGGAIQLAISEEGTLAYLSGAEGGGREIVFMDRQQAGATPPLPLPPRMYRRPRISPDGTRFAVMSSDQENDIYVVDFARPFLRRLTFNPGVDRNPIWVTRTDLVFGRSIGQGPLNVARVAADADAATEPTAVFTSPEPRNPLAASRDGRRIVIGGISTDLYLLDLDREGEPVPLVVSPFVEDDPALSPDDAWLAYESNESGTLEVYVRAVSGGAGHRQASIDGGQDPVWSGDSRTLFYRQGDAIWSVSVARGSSGPDLGQPALVLSGTGLVPDTFPNFDVSADGRRFLIVRAAGRPDGTTSEKELVVVENLFDELRRVLPPEPGGLGRLLGRR